MSGGWYSQAPLAHGALYHLIVGYTLGELGDRDHIVARFAQSKDYWPRIALVR